VHTIVNGQPVTQEFNLVYDAENRLHSVTGVSGTTMSAIFTYNGDGQKVKSVINGETIYFVNGYYEKKGSEITKYYFAGASRIATPALHRTQCGASVRKDGTLSYLLGDRLGSTSLRKGFRRRGNPLPTGKKP
jgi:hypothetical protein